MLNTISILCLFLSGSSHAAAASTNNWQIVAPVGAGFSVLMPGAPKESEKQLTSAAGPSTMHKFLYSPASGDEAYVVTYSDYSSVLDVERTLSGVRDAQVGKGHLIWEKAASQDGRPGKKIAAVIDGHFVVSEFYVDGSRLYQVIYSTSKLILSPLSAPAFIGSFRIVE